MPTLRFPFRGPWRRLIQTRRPAANEMKAWAGDLRKDVAMMERSDITSPTSPVRGAPPTEPAHCIEVLAGFSAGQADLPGYFEPP